MAKKRGVAGTTIPDSAGETSTGGDHGDNPLHDASSQYYVHPSENPSMVLVSPILDGRNYYEWARSMRMALNTKKKSRFVDGSIAKPETFDPLFPFWERCNNLILSWIQHAIS